jgi:hypothetical protein
MFGGFGKSKKNLNRVGRLVGTPSDRTPGAVLTATATASRLPPFFRRPYPTHVHPRWRSPPLLFRLRLVLTVCLCSRSHCRHLCLSSPATTTSVHPRPTREKGPPRRRASCVILQPSQHHRRLQQPVSVLQWLKPCIGDLLFPRPASFFRRQS